MTTKITAQPIFDKYVPLIQENVKKYRAETGRVPKLKLYSFHDKNDKAEMKLIKTLVSFNIEVTCGLVNFDNDSFQVYNYILDAIHKDLVDPKINGVMLSQTDEVKDFMTELMTNNISSQKDVAGQTFSSLGKMFSDLDDEIQFQPLVSAIIELLLLDGQNFDSVCIISEQNAFVQQLMVALSRLSEINEICCISPKKQNLNRTVRQADLVISAANIPNLITRGTVKTTQTIVDLGDNLFAGKLTGDFSKTCFTKALASLDYKTIIPVARLLLAYRLTSQAVKQL